MTPEELAHTAESEHARQAHYTRVMNVCVAAGCLSSGSDQVKAALEQSVQAAQAGGHCRVRGVGCMGLCSSGPMVAIEPDKVIYGDVQPEHATAIIDEYCAQAGNAYGDEIGPVKVDPARLPMRLDPQMPFFSHQHKIVLENCGSIDPERIEEYIAVGGYSAFVRAVTEQKPAAIIEQVMRSNLRGRGGAGYSTGLKWSTVAKSVAPTKYVICNADEGDPGAFMDRSILESDPHRVLEGMSIAAYAVGASAGFIYVRAEYPLAVKRLQIAIRQAERMKLLGANICGTPFDFKIAIRLGAGAYVCGEETALIASIEGRRGQPRPRPPYPAESGLWGKPTLINNVETFANIASILRNGPEWFSAIGTDRSKGTKVFALAGQVQNTGLIEVPMGTSLREIIFAIGGGPPEGRAFKAVQTGGPTGGCIPAELLDTPVDYESLVKLGSIMGSGGMIVMDDSACMVDVARYFMEFCMTESCGKCIPCRVGTAQMLNLLERITRGEGTPEGLALLEELCETVKATSLCGLGQSAPNPILSTLRYFRPEYLTHIHDHTCPAGQCTMPGSLDRVPAMTLAPTKEPQL
jgi:bidirectional [NiFe] hydrogenase diaphorase subunit